MSVLWIESDLQIHVDATEWAWNVALLGIFLSRLYCMSHSTAPDDQSWMIADGYLKPLHLGHGERIPGRYLAIEEEKLTENMYPVGNEIPAKVNADGDF